MDTKIVLAGLLGGFLPDVVRIVKERGTGDVPVYLTKWFTYVGLLLQIGLGAVAVYLVNATSIQQAILVGYAGPSIITNLVSKNERGGEGDKSLHDKGLGTSLLRWWGK